MQSSEFNLLQVIPPVVVMSLLVLACYFFYTKYVVASKHLGVTIKRIGATVRSMSSGDEMVRKAGVARVFQNTILEKTWSDFAKTLHAQKGIINGAQRTLKYRMTMPANYFFSVSAVIDQPLKVDYFKHLPGILTGIGIIGTFSGLLFGLSNFDASNPELMAKSVSVLLSGVREAFYASAAAITVAMVITHMEKMLYQRCLHALEDLVDAVNNLFEAGVTEDYLSMLVQNSTDTSDQARHMRDEFIQAMVPVIKQLESIQSQQMQSLGETLGEVMNESNRRLSNLIETSLVRQVKTPLEELAKRIDSRSAANMDPQEMARKVIRARRQENALENSVEGIQS